MSRSEGESRWRWLGVAGGEPVACRTVARADRCHTLDGGLARVSVLSRPAGPCDGELASAGGAGGAASAPSSGVAEAWAGRATRAAPAARGETASGARVWSLVVGAGGRVTW
ncbi:MAG: hypothetical protein R3F14_07440 [Polyangiaceae bacterium]